MKSIHLLIALIAFSISLKAQNVGIGTTSPTAQLHTTGTVRHSGLSGSGTRPVYADPGGNLLMTIPALPPSVVTNNSPQQIPDFNCTGVSSNIILSQLPASVSSASIRVTVNITHAKKKDLVIYLTAPNGGGIINLYATLCESGNNLINTTFTDAGDSLACYVNLTGDYIPKGSLAASLCGITPTVSRFTAMGGGNINPNGTWTLRVIDNTTTNTGTLNNWTVSVNAGIGADGVWNIKGNSGTNTNNFFGTTDDAPLRFRIKNTNSGRVDSARGNTGFGFRSLDSIYSGKNNAAFGYYALKNNKTGVNNTAMGYSTLERQVSGDDNTVVGSYAMYFTKSTGSGNSILGAAGMLNNLAGSYNTAMGFLTMNGNYSGSYNTAIGTYALRGGLGHSNVAVGVSALGESNYYQSNIVAVGDSALFHNGGGGAGIQDAKWNTAVGSKSLYSNTLGSGNTAHGYRALYSNTDGSYNLALGVNAMYSNLAGAYNTAIGINAMQQNIEGSNNTATGAAALQNNNGSSNTAHGYQALYSNTDGSYNLALGVNALYSNLTGAYNTAIGLNALQQNTVGINNTATGAAALQNNTGNSNTAHGMYGLYLNTTGSQNTASGFGALYSNIIGNYNTATGAAALNYSTGSWNTATGAYAMYKNTSGDYNTADGSEALYSNTIGVYNIAAGFRALYNNTIGNFNVAFGSGSLVANTSGNQNTAIGDRSLFHTTEGNDNTGSGFQALVNNFTGSQNTAIGSLADVSANNLTNATAIGYHAIVNASNKIRLGNGSVTVIEGTVNYTVSDERFKNNIKENVPGLDLITSLKPVSYQYKSFEYDKFLAQNKPEQGAQLKKEQYREAESMVHMGLIAQDVEKIMKERGYSFSLVHTPTNPTDNYSIAYGELIMPLVKAVQEQQRQIETLKKENAQLKAMQADIELLKAALVKKP